MTCERERESQTGREGERETEKKSKRERVEERSWAVEKKTTPGML